MTRTALFIAFLLSNVAGAGIASAAPIVYTINFAPEYGNAPTSASFLYDSVVPQFTDFFVLWEGITFDLTASANAPTIEGTLDCLVGLTGPAASFALLEGTCNSESYVRWSAARESEMNLFSIVAVHGEPWARIGLFAFGDDNDGRNNAGGSWGLAPVPEPATLLLSLSSLLALAILLRDKLRPVGRR